MKQRKSIQVLAICAVIILAAGCSKHSSPQSDSGKAESKPKQARTQTLPPPGTEVFNSYDVHDKFNQHTAWAVMDDDKRGFRGQAEWFVPQKSGQLNFFDLAVSGKGRVNIAVTDDYNGLPGKVLESFLNTPGSRSKKGHLVVVSTAHPALNAGTKYWVTVTPASKGAFCSWAYNNINLDQGFALERARDSWSYFDGHPADGAFRVDILK